MLNIWRMQIMETKEIVYATAEGTRWVANMPGTWYLSKRLHEEIFSSEITLQSEKY